MRGLAFLSYFVGKGRGGGVRVEVVILMKSRIIVLPVPDINR